jgi:hypothetical protein
MSGWGAGPCAGGGGPTPGGQGWRRGFGMGRGWGRGAGGGRGWRNRFRTTGLSGWQRAWTGWFRGGPFASPGTSSDAELAGLKEQAAELERALAEARSQIESVERSRGASPSTPAQDDR